MVVNIQSFSPIATMAIRKTMAGYGQMQSISQHANGGAYMTFQCGPKPPMVEIDQVLDGHPEIGGCYAGYWTP